MTDYSLTILCLDQQVPLGHIKISTEKIISVLVIPMMLMAISCPYRAMHSMVVLCKQWIISWERGKCFICIGKMVRKGNVAYAQLGGNQAKPGSSEGTTVNVVLRYPDYNARYYHYKHLPKIPLFLPLFKTATDNPQKQLGTDR